MWSSPFAYALNRKTSLPPHNTGVPCMEHNELLWSFMCRVEETCKASSLALRRAAARENNESKRVSPSCFVRRRVSALSRVLSTLKRQASSGTSNSATSAPRSPYRPDFPTQGRNPSRLWCPDSRGTRLTHGPRPSSITGQVRAWLSPCPWLWELALPRLVLALPAWESSTSYEVCAS